MVDILGQDSWSWYNMSWSMLEEVSGNATEKSDEYNLNERNAIIK